MLNICKASAGSGKTHKLTGEYLRLLFADSSLGKEGYKSILAVTFTNKATDEMKQRILDELYILSLPGSNSLFLKDILSLESISNISSEKRENFVRTKARAILVAILNDYSLFNISTIDSFFQHTLRSFAREAGQYSSYNVELDRDVVLNEALDMMMNSLEENENLLNWMIQISIEAIENGENWNTTDKLQELGRELFSEKFKIKARGSNALKEKTFIEEYRKILSPIVTEFENHSLKLGQDAMRMISSSGLSCESFTGASRSPFKIFEKLAKGEIVSPSDTFVSLADNPDKWCTSKSPLDLKDAIASLYDNGLNDIVRDTVTLYSDTLNYTTASVIISNLRTSGILSDIYRQVVDYCHHQNIVLLSQTTDFLNKIIDGSDTPFIYEKIGGRIDHYMLDEFQDTSLMQWENFKPLVKDSLDSGYDNLIVGDVKQSIYRWRSSDWNLLNSTINQDFARYGVKDTPLDSNWRSARKIIEFNNDFFKKSAEMMQSKFNGDYDADESLITQIYSSVKQAIDSARKCDDGHLSITFIDKEQCDATWKDEVTERLPDTINSLISRGYRLNDISILVRTNVDGANIANYLINNGFNVISEDSLLISSSQSVEKLIHILKYINNPNDQINAYLLKEGFTLPQERSLYNICEEILRSFTDDRKAEGAFIQSFLDCVTEYTSLYGSDLNGFVKWWDETGSKRSISAPEGEDSLRVLTIHKSKGLGFKVVIIPFLCDPFLKSSKDFLWCIPSQKPFDAIGLIPVRLNKQLSDTIFKEDYLQEILFSYIDVLNVCYVSFTRAKEELLIFAPKPKINKSGGFSISTMGDLLYSQYQDKLDADLKYEIGEHPKRDSDSKEINVRDIKDDGLFVSIPIGERLKLSFSGADFFKEDNVRTKGVLMHNILSEISVESDLEGALNHALSSGDILRSQYEELRTALLSMLVSVRDKHWYDGKYKHRNENAIVTPKGEVYRPDRVMFSPDSTIVVDYKFGTERVPAYLKQVQWYMSLLKKMGYPNVEGYLWYPEERFIEKI